MRDAADAHIIAAIKVLQLLRDMLLMPCCYASAAKDAACLMIVY